MRNYCSKIIAITSFALLLCYVEAGPARSIALAAVQKGSKIPRSIRAPFRNTEIMTARGFGKRAAIGTISLLPKSMKLLTTNANNADRGWNYDKRETKYFEEGNDVNDVNESFEEIFNEQGSDSIPIDWLANELSSNPGIIRAILYKFVDTNKDGLLSPHELMPPTSSSSPVIY